MYYFNDGMPESVQMWIQVRDVNAMQEALFDIIGAYERNFAKHPNVSDFQKLQRFGNLSPPSSPALPISAYDDLSAFKIYLADIGLLRRLAMLAPTAFGERNRLFTEFKDALT